MKHKNNLFLGIGLAAVGLIGWIIGTVVASLGIIYHAGGWFQSGWYEYTTSYYVGLALSIGGFCLALLSCFVIGVAFLREYLDRKLKET